jgi:hypothetical protein
MPAINSDAFQTCISCGCLVARARKDEHAVWHEALAEAARKADSADSWNRPLGGGL